MSGPIARTWAAALVVVTGTATMQANADTFYVNGSCGDDAWTGTSNVCSAPNGQKLTIQAGIDASVNGDEVIVADGTYIGLGNKNLDFGGRLIILRSENGPAACVIDCEGRGRGFRFHNSETAEAVLEGFTIRNGEHVNGGAILCRSASPTILNCVLANNQSREGGGLYSFGGNPTISNCMISENASLRGAGLMLHGGSPTVTDCEIVGNWLFGTAGGGGMNNANSDPTVTNCTFSENSGDFGAGMYNVLNSAPTVTHCTFTNNTGDFGGGMSSVSSSPTVTNCMFTDNTAVSIGGGMEIILSSPTVTNCTFTDNAVGVYGGGMSSVRSSPTVTNCTFANNFAGTNGGGMYNWFNSSPTVTNCVLWNDRPDEIVDVDGAVTTVRFSDVQRGWPGTGNIAIRPRFRNGAEGNYRLRPISPCIDAADNRAVPSGILTDLDGNPRFVDVPLTPDTGVPGGAGGDAIVDMGAYEFPCNPCDMNCDGSIDGFDVEPFLGILFNGATPCGSCTGDTNGDGMVNAGDIEPFIQCLFP